MNHADTLGSGTSQRALLAHVVPFGAWLVLMHFLDVRGLTPAMAYALRSALCVGLLAWLRPWRWYAAFNGRNALPALLVGVAVFVLWVGGESAWLARWPAAQDFYVRWAVRPFGELRPALESTPYAPSACGWPLAVVRMLGSGLVIAVIEEFFWRGFVYRWMLGLDFTKVDPGRYAALPFMLVAIVFAAEHVEWFAGLLTGLLYGWLFLRTRDIWAAVLAHVVTNLMLGGYVLATGSYQFW